MVVDHQNGLVIKTLTGKLQVLWSEIKWYWPIRCRVTNAGAFELDLYDLQILALWCMVLKRWPVNEVILLFLVRISGDTMDLMSRRIRCLVCLSFGIFLRNFTYILGDRCVVCREYDLCTHDFWVISLIFLTWRRVILCCWERLSF